MVFFICDACQETLKKNKVEQHCLKCRNCWVLSCVDCGKHFEGDAYAQHTSCISEAEKYEGALYKPKNGNNGKSGALDVQTKWVNHVHGFSGASSSTSSIINTFSPTKNCCESSSSDKVTVSALLFQMNSPVDLYSLVGFRSPSFAEPR